MNILMVGFFGLLINKLNGVNSLFLWMFRISCHTSVITFVYYETKENERYGLQITDR